MTQRRFSCKFARFTNGQNNTAGLCCRRGVAFSTGRNISRQIAPGESYAKINKVITIVIADYDMIEADEFYHHIFKLYDSEKRVLLTDVMEIHTLE
ncbi:MAG: Rpn family recombination-promoting nuclease/putative transposase, partial [Synergistaceae bacterium]|nr:Rpn family recombination-promoting nuclease/putative transposase [Synergistaceae bacterium]